MHKSSREASLTTNASANHPIILHLDLDNPQPILRLPPPLIPLPPLLLCQLFCAQRSTGWTPSSSMSYRSVVAVSRAPRRSLTPSLVQLILALYSPSTCASDQSALQLQLQHVQSSPAAWSIVARLLAHDDPSVRFFAASTLQLSISRSWSTLPESDHGALKASLLTWLAVSSSQAYPVQGEVRVGERVVMRKLASALRPVVIRSCSRLF